MGSTTQFLIIVGENPEMKLGLFRSFGGLRQFDIVQSSLMI